MHHDHLLRVSSLYGRVYRNEIRNKIIGLRFLPVWEGVSCYMPYLETAEVFPPYTGGCVGTTSIYRRDIMYNPNSKSIGSRITNDMLPRVEDRISFLYIENSGRAFS